MNPFVPTLVARSPLDGLNPLDLERMVLSNITMGRRRDLAMIPRLIRGGVSRLTATRLKNILARQTQARGYDFGTNNGTPPRRKTVVRLALQQKFKMNATGVRLSPEQGGGHPTKRHTAGRMN